MSLPTTRDQCRGHLFANASAELFWHDDQLCSGAVGRRARLMKLLWEEGLIEELGKLGLIAEVAPVAEANLHHEFAVRLRRSFRLSYCYEWCPEMWKAGALYLTRLLEELARFQLTIEDLLPHNLVFDGPQPVYINPATFSHLTSDNFGHAINSLSEFFLYPITLSSSGKSHLARRLLRGVTEGIKANDFVELQELAARISTWAKTMSPLECLRELQNEVERMPINDAESEWSNYTNGNAPLIPEKNWSQKQHQVHRVLSEHRPRSVLDLACNVGWYSKLAATMVPDVIAADFDETCVNRLYRSVQSKGDGILPVLMNVIDPSPGFGVGNSWLLPASQRFQSDLVLALAVSHHLVFSNPKLTFEQLVHAFDPFVQRWLLIEWIPFDSPGMIYSTYDRPESARWYDLESFVAAFAKRFSAMTVLPGEPQSRRLVLCER